MEKQENWILLVDDEESIRVLYSEFLKMSGYCVETAATAGQALQFMRENRVGLIFLDLSMPGVNGLELCRQIKGEFPGTVCYAITGNYDHLSKEELEDAGFSAVILKPIQVDMLLSMAEKGLSQKKI